MHLPCRRPCTITARTGHPIHSRCFHGQPVLPWSSSARERQGRRMRALASRMYETGVRIGLFSDGTPDPEADDGYSALVKREKEVVEEMRVVAMAQRSGLLD